jgi:RNA recognition motif-containing protein
LAYDVTDDLLQETFRAIYPSVKGAKVITDTATGRSKGYGFVDFGNANEQLRAMTEMNGMLCSSRPMRIGPAVTKKNTVYQQPYPKVVASASENDSNNTTLFVAGLDPTVTVEMLTQSFVQFGELVHVKIPVGKRFGFVQFSNRASAEVALQMLYGTVLGQQPIRLSWGRNPANLIQIQQPDPNQWNGDVQGYNAGYGYVTEPQDPNMYSYTVPNANYHQQDPNQWNGDAQGYNADYGYVTQSQDPNMYSYTAPNANYRQQDPNYNP